ncbi:MAG TPA: hypothetical protein VIK33_20100 [Anaerolineae bacterium]
MYTRHLAYLKTGEMALAAFLSAAYHICMSLPAATGESDCYRKARDMGNRTKPGKSKAKTTQQGWPLVVYVGIFGLGILGYLLGELALVAGPHPLHWLAALIGVVIGGFAGWLWYWRRGDIV